MADGKPLIDWTPEKNPRNTPKRKPIGKFSNRGPGKGRSIYSTDLMSRALSSQGRDNWDLIDWGHNKKDGESRVN